MKPSRAGRARWLLSMAVGLVLVVLLLRVEDPGDVLNTIRHASLALLSIAVTLALGFALARTWRFSILLGSAGRRAPGTLVAITLAGWTVNLLLPGPAGDATFVWLARRQLDVPIARGTGAVVMARLLDACSLLLIALSTAYLADIRVPRGVLVAGLALTAGVLGVLIALLWSRSRVVMLHWLAALPIGRRFATRMEPALGQLSRSRSLGGLVASTVTARCFTALLYFVLFAAVGQSLSLWQVWFALAFRTLLLAVPIQGIGGFGTTQLWWSGALTLLGWPFEEAVAAALAVHVLDMGVSLPVGLAGWAALAVHRRRPTSTAQPVERNEVRPAQRV
jgi:glycosyltransferase 2 family protein